MARPKDHELAPRINNRRATHEYFITGKVECGIVLLGSEVKSLRLGKAQLTDSFAKIEGGRLMLLNCHIDPYEKAGGVSHIAKRPRILLAHKREIKRLENETREKGTTLVPLAIYFKEGLAKVEIGVATGKQSHDKRETIKRKEQDKEMRRATSVRR
jgi:SsrA-binding protein